MTIKEMIAKVNTHNDVAAYIPTRPIKLVFEDANFSCMEEEVKTYKDFAKFIREYYVDEFAKQILEYKYYHFGEEVEFTDKFDCGDVHIVNRERISFNPRLGQW